MKFLRYSSLIIALVVTVGLAMPQKSQAVNVWGDWFSRTAGQKGFDDIGFGRNDPRTIAANAINILLGLLGVLAIVLILYAGFRWMTASGDPEKVELAKKILVSASIGLLIILSAWAVSIYVLSRLWLATGTQGSSGGEGMPCTPDGLTTACGCGGERTCIDGAWGPCEGSDCGGLGGQRKSCDSNILTPACEADDIVCGSDAICDPIDCFCSPKGGFGDACDSDTTSSTCEADTNLCQQFLTCEPTACLCLGEPVIESISPVGGFCDGSPNTWCASDVACATFTPATCNLSDPNGAVGNLVSISGRYFLPFDGIVSKVFFWDGTGFNLEAPLAFTVNPSCSESWNDSQIVVAVPAGAKTGAIKVVAQNGADTTDNTRGAKLNDFVINTIKRPGLCNLNPISGRLDTSITYAGAGLVGAEAYFGLPYQGIKAYNSSFISDTTGSAQAPNLRAGLTSTFVQAPTAPFSNSLRFTQEAEDAQVPLIVDFEPITGPAGQYVTIRGSGFGRSRASNQVYFGTTPADFDFPQICTQNIWRDSEVIVKVPKNLPDGDYKLSVEVNGFRAESGKNFKADKNSPLYPGLCKIEPLFGQANEPISLWGEHFGSKTADSKIRFNQDKDRVAGTKICQGGTDDGNNCLKNSDCDTNECVEELAYWGTDNLSAYKVKSDLVTTRVPFGASTGPVRLSKGSQALLSNSINFTVGQCASDDQCGGTNVCCAVGTPSAGRCKESASSCYGNAEASVFEWEFNTGTNNKCSVDKPYLCQDGSCCRSKCVLNATTNLTTCLDNASCSGYGANQCLDSLLCPNSPGNCSNNDQVTITGTSCSCALLGCPNCTYDEDLNRCVSPTTCDLKTKIDFKGKKLEKYCALESGVARWHVRSQQTCPDGYNPTFSGSGICVDTTSTCQLCSDKLACLEINGVGQCAMPQLTCPVNFTCQNQVCTRPGGSCECCCDKTQNKSDGSNSACCAGLTCANSCGAGGNFGSCSGCAEVGSTQEEHDAACNCTGTSGKYCDTSVAGGVCRDCGQIGDPSACGGHATCCVDFKQGNACVGVKDTKFFENGFNYCAYFSCSDNCSAPSNPNKDGVYSEQKKCLSDCPLSCDGDSQTAGCQADQTKCPAGTTCDQNCLCQKTKISCDDDPTTTGCQANQNKCPANQPICNDQCFCESSDLGSEAVCATNEGACSLLCGQSYNCRGLSGCQGLGCNDQPKDEQATCRCCCDPSKKNSDPKANDFDSCRAIGSGNLNCQENMGECSGNKRGLCCGAKSDADCGDVDNVGVGSDTCCHERPRVESVLPQADSTGICRNGLIRAKFNKVMDKGSLTGNVILVGDYGGNLCPSNSVLLANAPINNSGSWLANLWQSIKNILSQVILGNKEVRAAGVHNFCAFEGNVVGGDIVDIDQGKTYVDFAVKEAMSPDTKYYVIIKGQEGTGVKNGVLDSNLVGFLGTNNSDTESFNGLTYPTSYIWSFTTGADFCYLDNVKIDPDQHLFQKPSDTYNFTATPLAKNGQIITPLATVYDWTWTWRSDNSQVASVQAQATGYQAIVTSGAKRDAETFIYARAVITADTISPVSTVKTYKEGKAKIIVFLCTNPWPAVNDPNAWPVRWQDQSDNCTVYADPNNKTGQCLNYNFEFYYCRDKSGEGFKDDLPSLATDSPIRAHYTYNSMNRWVDVLKEFYFFRALLPAKPVLSPPELTGSVVGGEVKLSWTADANMTYKIYYGTASGRYSEVVDAVSPMTISGLTNGLNYYFVLTATDKRRIESDYSDEVSIKIEDKVGPAQPQNVKAKSFKTPSEKHITINWDKDPQDVLKYVLEYGPNPSPAVKVNIGSVNTYTISNLNNLDKQIYYLKLMAQDLSGNVGASVALTCPACSDPAVTECECH